MQQNKLIESISDISDFYIEEALNMPVNETHTAKSGRRTANGNWRPKLAGVAAAFCIAIGVLYAVYFAPPFSPDKTKNPSETQNVENKILTPLKVVAYAAETTGDDAEEGTELKADVPTTLSKYSALMSSVPAMPFSFSYDEKKETDNIHFIVSADDMGIMQKYEVGVSWKLTEEAASLECEENEKVYWMPVSDFQNLTSGDSSDNTGDENKNNDEDASSGIENINPEDLGADSIITVQVYSGETLLETRYIGISYNDMYYTATLKLNVTTDSTDYGDVTIESIGYETADEATHEKIRQKLLEKMEIPQEDATKIGGQEGTPSNGGGKEDADTNFTIDTSQSNEEENKQLEELMKQNPDGREYGYPTSKYFIEKKYQYHKK